MDIIKCYDTDGFELEFDDDTPTEERIYYSQQYPNLKSVVNKRNHCTTCSIHIGTPLSAEDKIKMHTVLRVTQCAKCYRFCNSGEYDRDEDGSELYCRWCGQGGDLYCCTGCPYVFCEKCILRNFSYDGLQEVVSNDNWKCYACVPKTLYPLRAQHWALVNYIKKQKQALESKMMKGLSDQDAIAFYMQKDATICCPTKTTVPKRRRPDTSDEEDDSWSEPNNVISDEEEEHTSEMSDDEKRNRRKRKKMKVKSNGTTNTEKRMQIVPRSCSPPVTESHTRIDTKPSRKRKSSPASTETSKSSTAVDKQIGKSNFPDCTHETNDSQNDTVTSHKKPKTSATSNPTNDVSINAASSTVQIKGNAIDLPVKRIIYPKTGVGRARTKLESKMFNAMEVCQQFDGKVKALMNSIGYKTANKMNYIKDQYIQLSHLLTYTNDQVQTIQKKCMDDLRKLGFNNDADALTQSRDNKKSGSDSDLSSRDSDEDEMDGSSDTIISLDDSDEEQSSAKKMSPKDNSKTAVKTKSPEDNLLTLVEDSECSVDVATIQLDEDDDHSNSPKKSFLTGENDDKEISALPPATLQNVHDINVDEDRKFNLRVKVVLKRAEKEMPDLMREPLLRWIEDVKG